MRTLIAAPGILVLSVSLGASAQRAASSQDPFGPPAGTGLVVVGVKTDISRGFQIGRGGGADELRGYLTWQGDAPRVVEGVESSGLIVFSGLQPGPYRLAMISAIGMSGGTTWPLQVQLPPDIKELAVEVTAGTPIYLGTVTVIDRQKAFKSPVPPSSTFDANPALAPEAWKAFLAKHGQTAWAARVREHLAGGSATAAPAAPSEPAAAPPSPLEQINALAQEADEAERNGTVRYFSEHRKSALAAAESDLAAHVTAHPDDARAMLTSVRLAWLRESTRPLAVHLTPGADADTKASDSAFAALSATVDRVLALEPNNAEAYFWKARLAAIELPAFKNGAFYRIPRDLPQAVVAARRAVELAPANTMYVDALATFLVDDNKPDEALEAVRDLRDGSDPHPITSILAAWRELPLPETAREQPVMAKGFTYVGVEEGKITSYPNMRVRMYSAGASAAEVEAFYKRSWKTFKLFKLDSEKNGTGRLTIFGQFLAWSNGRLEPATSRRQVEASSDYSSDIEGLVLTVTEITNPPAESRARFPEISGDVFCMLSLLNSVKMKAR